MQIPKYVPYLPCGSVAYFYSKTDLKNIIYSSVENYQKHTVFTLKLIYYMSVHCVIYSSKKKKI